MHHYKLTSFSSSRSAQTVLLLQCCHEVEGGIPSQSFPQQNFEADLQPSSLKIKHVTTSIIRIYRFHEIDYQTRILQKV